MKKTNFEKFFKETDIDILVAINMFIKEILKEQKVPFEIESANFDNYIYDKLKEAENETNSTAVRYSSDEIFNSMKNIVKEV